MAVIFAVLSWNAAQAAPGTWGDWEEARKLYDSGQFQEALVSLTAHPHPTAEYFYNLGSIYFRLKEYSRARAAFEKADRLAPYNVDVSHNLRLTEEAIAQRIGRQRIDPASSWYEKLADRTTMDQVRSCLGLAVLFALILWIQPYRRTRSLKGMLLQPSGMVGTTVIVLMLAIFGVRRLAESHPAAIAVESRTIRSGPGDHYLLLSELENGMKVRFTGQRSRTEKGDWIQIRYAPDAVGWIPESSVLLL